MKRIVITEDTTGNVVGQWMGGDEQEPAMVSGRTNRSVSLDGVDYTQKRWNGTSFEDLPPVPVRIIPLDTFLDRITIGEHASFESLMETNPTARAWWNQLMGRTNVNLDSPRMLGGFAFVKVIGIPAIWPDEATADARIAEIRA